MDPRALLGQRAVSAPYGGSWYSENNALLSASWDLDLWGKNREKLKSAVSQQKAAQAEMQQARITLAASVARTYNQLAQLYALRDIAQREIANRETVGKITDGRVVAGLDTNVERQTARGNIATSQASLSDLDGQITTVRYQLAALLGKGPDRGLQIAMPVLKPGGAIALPGNLPADLVSRRPDIVAARWQVEGAMHDVKEAKAEFYPDVNLAAGFGFDAFGWGKFLNFASRQAQFGPAVHLPIFDGGALRAQLKGRYADFDLERGELQPDADRRAQRRGHPGRVDPRGRQADGRCAARARRVDARLRARRDPLQGRPLAATAGAQCRPQPPRRRADRDQPGDAPPRHADRR